MQIGKNLTVYYCCALSSGFFLLLCCLNPICLQLLNSICYKFGFFLLLHYIWSKIFPVVVCLPYWGLLRWQWKQNLLHIAWYTDQGQNSVYYQWRNEVQESNLQCFQSNLSLFFTVYQFEAVYNCTFFPLSSLPPHFLWLHLWYIILDHVWELELEVQCLSFYHLSYSHNRLSVTHMRKFYHFMKNEQSQAEGAAR